MHHTSCTTACAVQSHGWCDRSCIVGTQTPQADLHLAAQLVGPGCVSLAASELESKAAHAWGLGESQLLPDMSRPCRQVTTGSGELPAHIGHGFDPEQRFGRSSVRKAEASRYAALSAGSKPDSASGRSMHASPSGGPRLIITSGGSSRDGPSARAVSGDLLRPDAEPNRAQRATSISLVTAPDLSQTPASDRPLQRAAPSQQPAEQSAGGALSDAALGSGRASSQGQIQRHAEAQQASPYSTSLPPQQASAAGQAQAPIPSRVESLSHWGRQPDAQQPSGSPQIGGLSGQQGGRAEFEQRQMASSPATASRGNLGVQQQQQLLLRQQQHFQQEQHHAGDQQS